MSLVVHRMPTVALAAAAVLIIPLAASGAGARQGARPSTAATVRAPPAGAASGQAAQQDSGNGLVVDATGGTLTLSSAGYCKACSASVAQAVATLPGVQRADADPNAATFRITVQYDPAQADVERITGEVRKELVAYDLNKLVLHRTAEGVELSSGRFT